MGKYKKEERVQIKTLICLLGIILLLVLLGARFFLHKQGGEEEPVPSPPVPVVETLPNVWIMEVEEESLLIYRDGLEERYSYGVVETTPKEQETSMIPKRYQPDRAAREQIADVVLTDGAVTDVRVKNEKIRGVIIAADDSSIEVEGYGRLPLTEDFKGYRIYHTLTMCTTKDIAFGYDFTDLVMQNGKICAILIARQERMNDIRVLIKTSDYEERLHEEICISADTDYVVRYGAYGEQTQELHPAGEEIKIACDSDYFQAGRVTVAPVALTGKIRLSDVKRSQGLPEYRGYLELIRTQEKIAVVNIVALEEYLYSVVPSEMPASYPAEALKAQAICARTYAYGHMLHAAYPSYGAHVDDSASYQVYNNIAETERTTTAVKETYGQLLYTSDGILAQTYYYSTSCGIGSDAHVWKTEAAEEITYLRSQKLCESAMQQKLIRQEQRKGGSAEAVLEETDIGEYFRQEEHFADYIKKVDPDDFEAGDGWYRWTYQIKKLDTEYLSGALKRRYEANEKLMLTLENGEYVSKEIEDFTKVHEMYIEARGSGGVADELVIETDKGTYKVISEHYIRAVLCDGVAKVVRQNGSKVNAPYLLPSGFFILETGKKNGDVIGYTLTGGGFGHGVGMSQNGAKVMAERGYLCDEILLFFYDDCELCEADRDGTEGI